MDESILMLLVGGILALSVLIAVGASRIGVPSLVVFLVIGMLLGADNLGGIELHDPHLARTVGVVGLAAILFEGGLSTSWRRLRKVAVPAVLLSTVGVVLTGVLTGAVAYYLFDLGWLESLLLGTVVSSTDAAAVFATLRYTQIRRRIARTLEAESGGNDPMAIALTIGFISWIQQPTYDLSDLGLLLIEQLGLGLLVGVVLGLVSMWVFARLPNSIGAFAPVASLAAGALSFGVAASIGGSGFLAIYLVGLAIGSTPSRYRSQLVTFHEGIAFLAQVAIFIVLGLLVVPSELLSVAVPSLVLALLLIIFIRPVAVWASLAFSSFDSREKWLIGWAGLRGALPIVLGTFALSAHIEGANTVFNAVFFIVLASALIQGSTLEWMATRLGVVEKIDRSALEAERANQLTHELVEFDVLSQHSIAGATISEVGLPRNTKITAIMRKNKAVKPAPASVIQAGDTLIVDVQKSLKPELDDVFTRWRRRV